MKKLLLILILITGFTVPCCAWTIGDPVVHGTANAITPEGSIISTATLPATCATGEIYLDSDEDTDGAAFVCTAIDTWKKISDPATLADVATTLTITDDESDVSNNAILFTEAGDHIGDRDIKSDGDFTYNPGTGGLIVPIVSASYGLFSGYVSGGIDIDLDVADSVELIADNALKKLRVNDDADVIDYTLPTAASGLNICIYSRYANVVTIDVENASDRIVLDGTGLALGNAIDSAGGAGDYICLIAIDDARWINLDRVGVWVDGGAD